MTRHKMYRKAKPSISQSVEMSPYPSPIADSLRADYIAPAYSSQKSRTSQLTETLVLTLRTKWTAQGNTSTIKNKTFTSARPPLPPPHPRPPSLFSLPRPPLPLPLVLPLLPSSSIQQQQQQQQPSPQWSPSSPCSGNPIQPLKYTHSTSAHPGRYGRANRPSLLLLLLPPQPVIYICSSANATS